MKNKKDIFFIMVILVLVILLTIQYKPKPKPKIDKLIANSITDSLIEEKPNSNLKEVENIVTETILGDESITKIVSDESLVIETTTSSKNDKKAIPNAVKDTINNESHTNSELPVFVKEIESSNKLIITQNNKEIKVRLIGVHGNGSIDGLKTLLNNVEDLRIESDIKKNEKDYTLVYLWDGPPNNDGSNMININMIKNEYAFSTYDFIHPGIIEAPNIKYQQLFINAVK